MTEEAVFLAQIRHDPTDTTVRLVYADWLQERDDARAELIRVEENLHRLSVFDPSNWQLKQTRNELRARVPADWLVTMGYGPPHRPMFSQLPDGREDRWRLTDRFIELWNTSIAPGDEYTTAELSAAESRLSFALPEALREWYRLAGKRQDIWSRQDRVIFPEHLSLQNGQLLIRIENQGCARWYVRERDLHLPDPPVYGGDDDRCVSPTISAFALFAVVYETKFNPRVIWCEVSPLENARRKILRGLSKCDLPQWYWFAGRVRFWEGEDLILEHHAESWYATVRTEEAYQELVTRTDGRLERYR